MRRVLTFALGAVLVVPVTGCGGTPKDGIPPDAVPSAQRPVLGGGGAPGGGQKVPPRQVGGSKGQPQ
jgi:hypothetical protein